MTVLVTGGAGYIGSHTCLALLEQGHEVVVADNFCNSHPASLERVAAIAGRGPVVHRADVRDRPSLAAVFQEHSIEAVIHFAALKSVGESVTQPLNYYTTNLEALMAVLDVMGRHGCHRMVFSSSATVYGSASAPPFAEDAPLEATNPYGRTKLFAEEILRDLAASDERWRLVLLRYFNPVGAHESGRIGESPQGVPNNLFPYVTATLAGTLERLKVFGQDYPTPDGSGVRDYIHVCDLAEGHVAALRAMETLRGAEAINLGTGRGNSVLEVVNAFARVAGRPVPHEIVDRRPGDVAVSVADVSKAKDCLGWQARRDLDAMCRDAWRWQEQNPLGFNAVGAGD